MTCSVCHRAAIIVLTHTLRVGKRVVTWTECRRCFLTAEAER